MLLPSFQQALEGGEGEKLIGEPAQPDQDSPENIASVFIPLNAGKQDIKLPCLTTFACLLMKNCIDPATKYHSHLLLSHIVAKCVIHKRIVKQIWGDVTMMGRKRDNNLAFETLYKHLASTETNMQ